MRAVLFAYHDCLHITQVQRQKKVIYVDVRPDCLGQIFCHLPGFYEHLLLFGGDVIYLNCILSRYGTEQSTINILLKNWCIFMFQ